MPRLTKLTDVAQLREWRQQYRPIFSSAECLKHEPKVKDRLGTLQVNAYEEDEGSTELFNFSQLEDDAFTSSLHEENVNAKEVIITSRSHFLPLQKRGPLHRLNMAMHRKDWPQNPGRFSTSDPVKRYNYF